MKNLIYERFTKEELIEELKNKYMFIDITEAEEYLDEEDYRLDFETTNISGSIWYAKTRNDKIIVLETMEQS